jgi:hypothetical protein
MMMTVNSLGNAQHFRCECGWEGHEDELRNECTFHGTREEPPEYDAFCPECGGAWDDMVEAPLCIGCKDVFVKNEGDACPECTEAMLEDKRDGEREEAHRG